MSAAPATRPREWGPALRRFLPLAAALGAGIAALVWHLPDWLMDDRERVARTVEEIADAARRRHINDILGCVSASYRDRFHADREALGDRLRAMWFVYKRVEVRLTPVEVRLDPRRPDVAMAEFGAEVLLGHDPQRPPEDLLVQRTRGTDRFLLVFRRESGDWKVVECRDPKAGADSEP
jgi:hypothetical protein